MKKVKLFATVLIASMVFVACEKEGDEPATVLKFDPATVEVVAEGDAATVTITEGTAPFELEVAKSEDGKDVVKATVEGNKITIEGLLEGEVTIGVTDKNGAKGDISVTVTAKDDDNGEGEGEGEGEGTEE